VLLVFGGSRGARSLNRAVAASAERLCRAAEVIHISGGGEWAEVSAAQARLPAATQARYHAYPYLHDEMGDALAAADLVVSRAGASVLGEFPLFGLPCVLVPYPHAWRYQKVNADYLAGKGAAIVLEDATVPEQLAPTVERLLQDVTAWDAMRRAARRLALPNAAASIARSVMGLC
jgi:UDP-N-acetylglucosamine--N-acetylmuramyl-(pentapeptide) pyrophosphoryl-undecaprenol N-acetylglucosamine transferase